MFDRGRLQLVLSEYKERFVKTQWPDEMYKWVAIKCFQEHWDINAENFAEMLKNSLSKTMNLLASGNNYPATMIIQFAEADPERVRAMFLDLFDESKDVYERIERFKQKSDLLLEEYGSGNSQHFQRENAISTYLWLRYPDKYYIYKYSEIKAVAKELNSDYRFKKGAYAENIKNFLAFYDALCAELQKDQELRTLFESQLNENCYPDSELRTLTVDVGFFISRYFNKTEGSLLLAEKISTEILGPLIDKERESYSKEDFLKEVYMTESKYDRMCAVLKKKQNLILQGAPGVGKTFAARRLAYSMMGVKDDERIEFIQFHQNYSYEDFVMGYKPVEDGFELRYGIFYRFCQKAAEKPEQDFFFIIDEINRGNMSKIFGELLMLIESDYRGSAATLAYNALPFSVPKNLYLIGMMNTADRSLAMIDYALRRRFSFIDLEPGFDSEGFIRYQKGFANELFDALIECVKDLNREISQDKSLGKGFCIGHSYFCNAKHCSEEWMRDVVSFDILPMLSEYWFDETQKLQRWENLLQGVFQ